MFEYFYMIAKVQKAEKKYYSKFSKKKKHENFCFQFSHIHVEERFFYRKSCDFFNFSLGGEGL